MKIWYIYVILTVDGFYYTGISTDPERRYREHLAGMSRSARYLKAHRPEKLVFIYEIGDHTLALKVEYQFKKLLRRVKEKIITERCLIFDPSDGKIKRPQ